MDEPEQPDLIEWSEAQPLLGQQTESSLTDSIKLFSCDCREALATIADNSIDSIVTDPPYALVSVVKRFGSDTAAACKTYEGKSGAYKRSSAGFMGKRWDNGDVSHDVEFWAECLRVLKPGGFVLAFGGTRTYHRLACAIEDAGFEVRDMVQWIYGSGFPKSHDVSKGIDRAAGAEREVVGQIVRGDVEKAKTSGVTMAAADANKNNKAIFGYGVETITAPATASAIQWQGWGTALKPANEPICMARKPLSEKTVAANVLKWGTGAINVDGCRVEGGPSSGGSISGASALGQSSGWNAHANRTTQIDRTMAAGRWPANIIHDGSDEVVAAFPNAPGQLADAKLGGAESKTNLIYGKMNREGEASADRRYTDNGSTNFAATPGQRRHDTGSAARFFYQAKAGKRDRAGSKHPTVKPISLLRYLCRLVTPPGGTVLDPFAGSGTTGEACHLEGFKIVMVELEEEYQNDIRARMKGLME